MDNKCYYIIKCIINEWDPVHLLDFAPLDEYDLEIKLIADKVSNTTDTNIIAEIILKVFETSFGSSFDYSITDCLLIAKKIKKELYSST